MTDPSYSAALRSFLQSLTQVPTRRELLLFGLVMLSLFWVLNGHRPRAVVIVPDTAVRGGVIT